MTVRIMAAGYLRRSSNKQEASLSEHREMVERWASENDDEIIRWSVDDAISGDKNDKRDEYKRLIFDASDGDFEAVIAWKRDRFFGQLTP